MSIAARLCVAGSAERHKIFLRVDAALSNRDNMVNLIGTDMPPGSKALLAQGMLRNVQVSDCSPAAAIDFIAAGTAVVLVVLAVGLRGVFLTKPPRHQLRAAGMRAGLGGFVWQKIISRLTDWFAGCKIEEALNQNRSKASA